jgi:hypothetical protein
MRDSCRRPESTRVAIRVSSADLKASARIQGRGRYGDGRTMWCGDAPAPLRFTLTRRTIPKPCAAGNAREYPTELEHPAKPELPADAEHPSEPELPTDAEHPSDPGAAHPDDAGRGVDPVDHGPGDRFTASHELSCPTTPPERAARRGTRTGGEPASVRCAGVRSSGRGGRPRADGFRSPGREPPHGGCSWRQSRGGWRCRSDGDPSPAGHHRPKSGRGHAWGDAQASCGGSGRHAFPRSACCSDSDRHSAPASRADAGSDPTADRRSDRGSDAPARSDGRADARADSSSDSSSDASSEADSCPDACAYPNPDAGRLPAGRRLPLGSLTRGYQRVGAD